MGTMPGWAARLEYRLREKGHWRLANLVLSAFNAGQLG